MIEKSPKDSPQSNGAVENAVERVEGLLRTINSELQDKLGSMFGPKSLIMPWLVRRVGFLLTRYAARQDGRTPWERLGRDK